MRTLLSLVIALCCLLVAEFKTQAAPAERHALSLQLVEAVKTHDAAHVKRLLRAGANPNARDDSGRAVWRRIGKGTHIKPFLGPTVLMLATYRKDFLVAKALLDGSANPNLRGVEIGATLAKDDFVDIETRVTPLAEAMLAGSPKMMRLLLRHGANVNLPASDGTTPLQLLHNLIPTTERPRAYTDRLDAIAAVLRSYKAHL